MSETVQNVVKLCVKSMTMITNVIVTLDSPECDIGGGGDDGTVGQQQTTPLQFTQPVGDIGPVHVIPPFNRAVLH
jgi:uncharacterized protein YjdB